MQRWDAAVKRAFRLPAMLASMQNKSEAGVAKRLRMAGALNSQGRLLFFYGVGVILSSNYDDHSEFKWEATLLSQYLEDFASYTLNNFIGDFCTKVHERMPAEEKLRLGKLHSRFSLVKVASRHTAHSRATARHRTPHRAPHRAPPRAAPPAPAG